MITRRFVLQGATAAGAALALGKVAGCSNNDPEPPPARRPNVIVVLADDMRYDELPFMPNVTSLLVDEGVSFSAARHNISLCSPARAGFLTGQYSRRHRVRSQADAFGAVSNQHKTVAVWMQDAGYTTGLIGKYFTGGNRSAPGWDTKRQLAENPHLQFKRLLSYGPQLNPIERFGKKRRRATHNRLFDRWVDLKASLRASVCYVQTTRKKVKSLVDGPPKRTTAK